MTRTYLTIAIRNLAKHKTFSLINIGGLAISLASCLFIFYYVYDELTYDRSHEKVHRIFRITQTFIAPEQTQNIRWTHQKIGPYLRRLYPQVENFVRFEGDEARLGKSKIKEKGVVRVDPTVFDVFTYPLVQGNPETALKDPHAIVISETLAKKYFQGDALGASLEVDGKPYQVTAIMKDVPSNSDKWICALVHGDFEGEEIPQFIFTYDTYILLKSSEDAAFIRKQLPAIAKDLHHQAGYEVKMGYDMQALNDLHFFQGVEMDHPKGNKINVYIFAGVAFILLLVATFNFINLTTVRSLERAREVGIRKAAGAQKKQLILQFLSESFVAVAFAAIGALICIQIFRVLFESVSGKNISLNNQNDLTIVMMALLLLIAITLFSSFYPAWILSSYQPIRVLKQKAQTGNRGSSLRKIFTVAQFTLSAALLVFLVTLLMQNNFMRDTDLGFEKNEILVVKAPEDSLFRTNVGYFKNEFLKSHAVQQISVGGFASNLGTSEPFASPVTLPENGNERQVIVANISVDKNYPAMLQLKVKEGQSFADVAGENVAGKALVNESFVRLAGWTNPLGQKIKTYAGEASVIGVVKDFHFKSLHNAIEPMAIMGMNIENPDPRYFFMKTSAKNLDEVKVLWRKLFPDTDMDYFFLDDFFDTQYKTDHTLQLLFVYFTLVTILVSASGLLGLTLYHVEVKTAEIGIRKILGASTMSLIQLLSKKFIGLILSGTTFGIALGFFSAKEWLKNFAYHIEPGVAIITLSAGSIVILSISIAGYKTYRGASANPIDSIRHE